MSNKTDFTCTNCGEPGRHTYSGPEAKVMEAKSWCFLCAFWELRSQQQHPTVIDGCIYSPGRKTTGNFRGCAGRRFDIEYFDGRRITTFDLWVGGVVPEQWRNRIPDTARFLNGAERASVGEITCFNPSDNKTPPYPLPEDPK